MERPAPGTIVEHAHYQPQLIAEEVIIEDAAAPEIFTFTREYLDKQGDWKSKGAKPYTVGLYVEFTDGSFGYVEAQTRDEIKEHAERLTGKTVKEMHGLPYPASPRIRVFSGDLGPCPSFCWQPKQCLNRGSCPRPISCVE